MLVRTDIEATRAVGDSVRTVATDLATLLSQVDGDLGLSGPGAAAAATGHAATLWSAQLAAIADQLTLTGTAIVAAAEGYAEAERRAEQRYRAGAADSPTP